MIDRAGAKSELPPIGVTGDLFAPAPALDAIAADQQAREQASDPRRSILLEAPAGSGKTTVLTERLLRLLAQADQPEGILAITFTRKAAAEMRARVLKALRGDLDPSSAHGNRLRALAATARARAACRGWDLERDPGRLRIQTIDSFNFRLASQLSVTAGAGAALVITERPHELYRRAARTTLAAAEDDPELAADVELLFERLDNHWNNVQRLLAGMLEGRGHWLRFVLGHDPEALCARVAESLRNIVHDHLALACRSVPAALRAEAAALPGIGPLGDQSTHLASWKRLAELTLTRKYEWRRPTGINSALGAGYERATSREALRSFIERASTSGAVKETLTELAWLPAPSLEATDAAAIEALSRVLRFAAAHLQLQFALEGRVDHTYVAGAARAALTDVGQPTDLALRTGLSLRHILVDEFQDTSLSQFDLLEALTAGWEEGDGRTLFVVGDPMQSIYQFREAEVGLFLRARDRGIGSVKLRALRLTRNFRSQPALIEWSNEAFARLFPRADDLRSSAVSFTRSVAGQTGSPDAARQTGDLGAGHAPYPGPGAAVRVQLVGSGDREAETGALVERIAEIRAREKQASIAVLVAARAHAAPIMVALERQRIDAVGVDLVPLSELGIVRDLVALTRATSHLGDRTAWLAVLRAPWCGVSLATLTALSPRGDERLVWEALGSEELLRGYSMEECARLQRVRLVIEAALIMRDSVPLAEWLELMWVHLGGPDAYPASDLRHARAFFAALAERVTAGEWSGPGDLDALLDDLFAEPHAASANPVQIMTIHRAKGLEFDHVLVPSLDRDLNRGREPLLRWLDLPRAQGEGSDLIMAPIPAVGSDPVPDLSTYLKRLMAKRSLNERTRLLYVAATRARKTLHCSAALKPRADGALVPRAGTLLACLWPALGAAEAVNVTPALGPAEAVNVTPALGPTDALNATPTTGPRDAGAATGSTPTESRAPVAPVPLRRLPVTWTLPALQASAGVARLPVTRGALEPVEFSWARETSRHIGTIVHAALERFARLPELPTKASIEAKRATYSHELRRRGVPERELERAVALVVHALTNTIGSERGRWIFAPEHRDAHSELALTGMAAGRLTDVIIDRSFVDATGTRWVIDFKTSVHEGGSREAFLEQEARRYRSQLESYRALARQLGSHPVRMGLYFPLLDEFREVG